MGRAQIKGRSSAWRCLKETPVASFCRPFHPGERIRPAEIAPASTSQRRVRDRNVRGQLVRRAYENGPNDVDAILAYAWYHQWDDPDPAQHEALVRKALALDPLVEETYAQLTFIEQQRRRWDHAADPVPANDRFPN